MSKLPRGLPAKRVLRALIRAGFYARRRAGGSHIILRRDSPYAQVVVPDHRSLDTGTLDSIIESAGLTVDEFLKFL